MGDDAGDGGIGDGVLLSHKYRPSYMLREFVNVDINTSFVREILCHTFVQFGNGVQGLRI
jgi:hypothetical protein